MRGALRSERLSVDEGQGMALAAGDAQPAAEPPDLRTVCSVPHSGVSGTSHGALGQRQRWSASCVWDKQRLRPGLGVLKLPEHRVSQSFGELTSHNSTSHISLPLLGVNGQTRRDPRGRVAAVPSPR